MAVEEEDTEVDGRLTHEHLFQMIGMSNTIIGHESDNETPKASSTGCWDGDTFPDLVFTNTQVGIPHVTWILSFKIKEFHSLMREN